MVPYSSQQYEARENVLLIKSLAVETLGEYTCQAYNGLGEPASWSLVVKAYRTDERSDSPYLVERNGDVLVTQKETVTYPSVEVTQPRVPVYTGKTFLFKGYHRSTDYVLCFREFPLNGDCFSLVHVACVFNVAFLHVSYSFNTFPKQCKFFTAKSLDSDYTPSSSEKHITFSSKCQPRFFIC